jgi:hypothetical protein
MNNPSQAAAHLRSLITYAVCLPLAVFVGFLVTNPMSYSTLGTFGILALLLISPVLLRWHYPLLLFSLQASLVVFFIKGSPGLGLVMTAASLGISVLGRALNRNRQFIHAPQITWPLIGLGVVILFTAKLTGGIGLHILGSDVYGGKKYVYMALGILLYFALTARRIPPERAKLYVTLYFAGGMLSLIGDLYPFAPHWASPIFWFFPPSIADNGSYELGETRLGGISGTGVMLCCLVMARYGVRGILLSGKPWRLFFFILSILMIFLGGYRGQFFTVGLIFLLLFFREGLHRTRLLPISVFLGLFAFTLLVPLASKLPFTFQRTIAFLPLPLDSQARESAQDTLNWRIQMWTALLPQIPSHLLLGKGLAISPLDFQQMMGADAPLAASSNLDESQNPLALSYDYHNGPLSVLIPFGIWGAIAFLWLVWAGVRALRFNFRYGDPALQTVNGFLLASFVASLVAFLFVGGALSSDLMRFTGILGLSVALNGGVRRSAPQPGPEAAAARSPSPMRPRLQPAFLK